MAGLKTAHIVRGGKRGVDWHASLSPNGFSLGEVISAIIKEMRRGKEEESLAWALEMAESGQEAEDFLWENLLVFAIEDIGLADTTSLTKALAARDLYFLLPRGDSRRLAVLAYLLCFFCRSKKSRYSNELLLDLRSRIEEGEFTLTVPDYAIDMHTRRGRELDKGLYHYLTEAALLENEDLSFPQRYRDKLIKKASPSS